MFFILSKILFFFICPYIWVFAIILYAFFVKSAKRKRISLLTALIVMYLFSNAFILDEFARSWEIRAKQKSELKSVYDYGILLGGMSTYDKDYQRINFLTSTDRLMQTLDLYHAKRIKNILITGGAGSIIESESKESKYLYNYLIDIGIPSEDLLIESESKNTRENAVFTAQLLGKQKDTCSFLLITSASHLRRASACFQKVGFQFDTYATNRIAGKRKYIFDHMFLPNAGVIATWELLIKEWVGYATYKIMGYL